MSYYNSDRLLRDWAEKFLKQHLNPHDYPNVFGALRSPKKSQRLTRIEIGVLKLLLEDYRPERSVVEQKRYAESNAIKIPEIADTLNCNVSTVRRAKDRINKLVKSGAPHGSGARKHGLILFHGMGTMIKATFWDAIEARRYSEKMGDAQIESHSSNMALADEKKNDVRLNEERVRRFRSLSADQQEALLKALLSEAA